MSQGMKSTEAEKKADDSLRRDMGKSAAMVTYKAVSYTHLRAHETVLDLVCRLLLEKKTNTIIICVRPQV